MTLSPEEERRLAARPIADPRAFEIWLRARQDFHTFTTEGLERGFHLLEQALAIVGDNALIYAGLATFCFAFYDVGVRHDEETLRQGEQYATRALELDPQLPQALLALGLVRAKRGQVQDFSRLVRRAVDAGRDCDALVFLAFILAMVGRIDEARRYGEEAVAADPLAAFTSLALVSVDFLNGQFTAAAVRLRDVLERLAPGDPLMIWWLAQVEAYGGRNAEGCAAFEQVAKMRAGFLSDLSEVTRRALIGDRGGVHDWLDGHPSLRDVAMTDQFYPFCLATVFACIGDTEEALTWLTQAVSWGFSNHRFLAEHNRLLAPLRGDPRLEALMEKAREKEREFEV